MWTKGIQTLGNTNWENFDWKCKIVFYNTKTENTSKLISSYQSGKRSEISQNQSMKNTVSWTERCYEMEREQSVYFAYTDCFYLPEQAAEAQKTWGNKEFSTEREGGKQSQKRVS